MHSAGLVVRPRAGSSQPAHRLEVNGSTEVEPSGRDDGAALVIVLVLMLLCSLVVLPMLSYAITVTRSTRVLDAKAERVEAVKGGLRMALANPTALYKACENAGLNAGPELPTPQRNVNIETRCTLMDTAYSEDETKRPYGVSVVQANQTVPAYFVSDPVNPGVYPGGYSAQPDPTIWHSSTNSSLTRKQYTIWTPNLPVHALTSRLSFADSMPSDFGACNVYFPGTYTQPVVISSSTPVYFTSGIYYFEDTVTMTGDAHVVVGGGSVEGCTTDQDAAFYANNAPPTHNITGLGATFVFGMAGRLIVDNSVAGSEMSIVFNQRYVHPSDINSLPSASVNIMSVNGYLAGSNLTTGVLADLSVPGVLSVPKSVAPTTQGAFGDATLNKYRPSTLVPPDLTVDPLAVDTNPIVDVNLTTASPVNIEVPGYVAVPQGRFRLSIPAGSGFGVTKSIAFSGGVLARTVEIPGENPAQFSIGVEEIIVQLILRIHTKTMSGTPVVESDAIVQVNKNGAYAVNTWAVQ